MLFHAFLDQHKVMMEEPIAEDPITRDLMFYEIPTTVLNQMLREVSYFKHEHVTNKIQHFKIILFLHGYLVSKLAVFFQLQEVLDYKRNRPVLVTDL